MPDPMLPPPLVWWLDDVAAPPPPIDRGPTSGEFDMARRSSGFFVRIGGSDGEGRLNVGLAVGECKCKRGERESKCEPECISAAVVDVDDDEFAPCMSPADRFCEPLAPPLPVFEEADGGNESRLGMCADRLGDTAFSAGEVDM